MLEIEFGPNVVNIVLLGSDERSSTGGYRTDTIMILSLDPDAGTVTVLSIPRDLYVYIPGWRVDRINTADAMGGFETTAMTILYNIGIEIHHWVRVNFNGFTNIVNTLGGIYVESTSYLYDECGGVWRSYGLGTYYMNGFEALCYVRMRKASSDFDRLRRQQEVAKAVFNKILSLDGLSQIPELYSQFNSMIHTDMELNDLLPLVPLVVNIASDPSQIHTYTIDQSMVTSWRVPYSGASVLLPDYAAISGLLRTAFGDDSTINPP